MALIDCGRCGNRFSDVSGVCTCGWVVQETDELLDRLEIYIDDNWDSHYAEAFGKLLRARRGRTIAGFTWNWAAALFPVWFLYRRLYVAFIAILFVRMGVWWVLSPGTGLWPLIAVTILQGVVGDRLLFEHACGVAATTPDRGQLPSKGEPIGWYVWAPVAVIVSLVSAALVIA